jgi:hypothetical protein
MAWSRSAPLLTLLALALAAAGPALAGDEAADSESTAYKNVLLTVTLTSAPESPEAARQSYQMLVRDGSKAEMISGSRLPIPTTSFNTSSTTGGNVVPVTSYTYQVVGLTLRTRARILSDGWISLELSLESSFVSPSPAGKAIPSQPVITTLSQEFSANLTDGATLRVGSVDDPTAGRMAIEVLAEILD